MFTDSNALLSHFGNVSHIVGPQAGMARDVTVEIFGDASPEVRGAFAAFAPTYFATMAQ